MARHLNNSYDPAWPALRDTDSRVSLRVLATTLTADLSGCCILPLAGAVAERMLGAGEFAAGLGEFFVFGVEGNAVGLDAMGGQSGQAAAAVESDGLCLLACGGGLVTCRLHLLALARSPVS